MKVAVIGAGKVGSLTALRVGEKNLGDVVLVDVVEGLGRGLGLDLAQSAAIEGFTRQVVGTDDFGETAGADVVVMTAGFARTPGMSRLDLLKKNAEVVAEVMGEVKKTSPDALIINVTNPVDEMTYLAAEVTGFPKQRVMGMAGTLDSARFKYFISEATNVPLTRISAQVLGSHGDCMVPLTSRTSVDGRPLSAVVDSVEIKRLTERTKSGGGEIVSYLKHGSAFFAPSAATVEMIEAIAADMGRVLSVSAWVSGQYGLSDIFIGVPARLGRDGVAEIVELPLNPEEGKAMAAAGALIKEKVEELGAAGF